MSAPRFAKRRDNSESGLVRDLRSLGATVYLTDQPYDAIVGIYGTTDLVEFKTPDTQYGKKLNENQSKFNEAWQGSKPVIMRTTGDVQAWFYLKQNENKAKRNKRQADVSAPACQTHNPNSQEMSQ